jgi:hypothetical protein
VALSGLVSRELRTDAIGTVSFVELPDGRYDVVASLKGFPSSRPRVLDVTGIAIPVDIVLKPSAPLGSVVDLYVPAAPATLQLLASGADAIVHARIERQRTYRRKEESDERGRIMTASAFAWVEAFKSSPRVGAQDEVIQGGGRVENPEDIEVASVDPQATLNIGDEYVLFLKRYDELGYVVLHHGPAGAFRIRNGRVEPLGRGALASAWKDRSAAKFFEALRRP